MKSRGEPFFFYMALGLIVIVIGGFSLAAIQRPGGPLATPMYLHFHGAIFLSWFLLLAIQARLAGTGSLHLHRRLGHLSGVLALSIVLIGYIVVRLALAKEDITIAGRPALYGAVFPITDIVNFSIAFGLAIANRANAAAHKRLMLISAIVMIDPAMARLVFSLGLPSVLILALEVALILSLPIYDVIRRGLPHWASGVGLALFGSAFVLKSNVENFAWWPAFIETAF